MFKDRIIKLLEENMTEKGFALWNGINQRLPDIWENPTSSTGKYHKKMNGDVPTQAEHVYHMLYSTVKLFRMFNIETKTADADKMLFAVALHDSLKYGQLGTRKHTDYHLRMRARAMPQKPVAPCLTMYLNTPPCHRSTQRSMPVMQRQFTSRRS